jgi:hypothetical protein
MRLKTFAVAGSDSIQIGYTPSELLFTDISVVDAIKVTIGGVGVTFQLTGNANIVAYANMGKQSPSQLTKIELTNGLLSGKSTQIEITVTGATNVYGSSTEKGDVAIQVNEQTVQANSAEIVEDFYAVLFPNAAINDQVTYSDIEENFDDVVEIQELKARNSDVDYNATAYITGEVFDKINFRPNATQVIVVCKALTV